MCEGLGITYDLQVKNCTQSLLILHEWIAASTYETMSNEIDAEPGDIYYITQNAKNLVYVFSRIVKFLEKKETENGQKKTASNYQRLFAECEQLILRIKKGVPDKYLDLCEINQISRVRAQNLYKNGFKNRLALKKAKVEKLVKIDGIDLTIANNIKAELTKIRY